MTEREAITELKRKAYRTTCYGNKVLEHEENLIAIEALEKQIAKKIIRRKATDEDVENELRDFITSHDEICCCPNCGDFIAVYDLKYCWECGQKLDFGDDEK